MTDVISNGAHHLDENKEEDAFQFPSWFDEAPVEVDTTMSTVVIVDNIPVTKMNRYEKLYSVIRKIFSAYGTIIDDGLYIPVEGPPNEQQTCGYAFIEYSHPDEAAKAVAEANHKKLDEKHTLLVNAYDDYDRFESVTPEWTPPNRNAFESKVNLQSWLYDEAGRDQIVVRFSTETHIYWNDPFRRASEYGRVLQYGGEREKSQDKHWTDLYTAWSPKGTYLLTYHLQGVVIWGGDQFEKIARFAHPGIQHITFSPNEKFLVTSNGTDKVNKNDPDAVIVWDIRAQKKLRGFEKIDLIEKDGHTVPPPWPIFKWSYDDNFVAKLSKDAISVYETPSMGLVDKKSIKILNVAEFVWSPAANQIAYWVPSADNTPATVAIVEIPSKQILREKHFYNVVDIKLHWNETGEFMCMRVVRRKTKKTTVTNLEIVRIRHKGIPIEVIEVDDNISGFAWDYTNRFALIHGDASRNNVSIWNITEKKVNKLHTFESRPVNTLYWSPSGSMLLLAGLGTMNGQIEWVDCDAFESLVATEHFNCNEIEWDPSGRYLITAVTQPIHEGGGAWRYTMDNGYRLWTMQGVLLATVPLEQLHQVMWRPRPKKVLTKEQIMVSHTTQHAHHNTVDWSLMPFISTEVMNSI